MIILVDQDSVLTDFESGFLMKWRKAHPDKPYIPLEERTTFRIRENYPKELTPLIDAVYSAPGFYRSIPLMPGGKEAIIEMQNKGHDVFICTSPLTRFEDCVLEKYLWTEEQLGREWTKKIILTNDKTVVIGDYLIDDNPDIKGAENPIWEHIIFDQPYNRQIKDKKRIIKWQNWREVLNI